MTDHDSSNAQDSNEIPVPDQRQLSGGSVLASWEDEDRNRYFPIGDGWFHKRDGGTGAWWPDIHLTPEEEAELRRW